MMKQKSINNSGGLICYQDYCEWTKYRMFFEGLCVGAVIAFIAIMFADGSYFKVVAEMVTFIGG